MFVTFSKIKVVIGLLITKNLLVLTNAGQSEIKLPVPSLTEQLIEASNATITSSDSSEVKADPEYLKSNTKNKRNPKLSIPLPTFPIPGLFPVPTDSPGSYSSSSSGLDGSNVAGDKLGTATGLSVASTAVLIKSGILGGLTAFKAAIIPPLFIGSMVLFLIAGAVFFTCSVFNCGFGPASTNGSPSLTSFFNRNGYDYYEQQVQPVYQSLDEGYKKFQ